MTHYEFVAVPLAELDMDEITEYGRTQLGSRQAAIYGQLISRAIDLLLEDPFHPASRVREDLGPHIRSFHIKFAARRKSSGRHVLYYMPTVVETKGLFLLIRILHDRRDATEGVHTGLEQAWEELLNRLNPDAPTSSRI